MAGKFHDLPGLMGMSELTHGPHRESECVFTHVLRFQVPMHVRNRGT